MNTNKNILIKKESLNTGNKINIAILSVCILSVLISLLILVGILS